MSRADVLRNDHERKRRRLNMRGDDAPVASGPSRDRGLSGHRLAWPAAAGLLLIALAAVAVWAGIARNRDGDEGLSRAAERYKHAVGLVMVDPDHATGEPGYPLATAWALSATEFASCAHVIEEVIAVMDKGLRVYVAINGQRDQRLYVRRASVHRRYGQSFSLDAGEEGVAYDVGLMEMVERSTVWFPVAGTRELARLRPGYRVASLGYPMERLFRGGVDPLNPLAVMQSGIVTAVSDFALADAGTGGNLLIRHNLGSTGGSSGSPLFNARGQVVGIVSAGSINLQLMGVDEKGDPVLDRTPSAVMINFAQRVDLLGGVPR